MVEPSPPNPNQNFEWLHTHTHVGGMLDAYWLPPFSTQPSLMSKHGAIIQLSHTHRVNCPCLLLRYGETNTIPPPYLAPMYPKPKVYKDAEGPVLL